MNTAWGGGSSSRAWGAMPKTGCRLPAPNLALFCSSRAKASGWHSTAYTWPWGHSRAASTATEPVPAPTSHSGVLRFQSQFGKRRRPAPRFLVMGALPRKNAPSGMPGTQVRRMPSGRRLDQRPPPRCPTSAWAACSGRQGDPVRSSRGRTSAPPPLTRGLAQARSPSDGAHRACAAQAARR